MLWNDGKHIVHSLERCCQCGVCLAACPTGALSVRPRADGLFAVAVDEGNCTHCGRCARCCPAQLLPDTLASEVDWEGMLAVGLGCANDGAIRHRASSGGVARLLVRHALQSGLCDYAYCLVRDDAYPWAQGAYLTDVPDLSAIANSMYLPIPVLAQLARMRPHGALLIVGTPCQLLAAEQYFRTTQVTLMKVAILCKQQKTYRYAQFIQQQLGIRTETSMPIQFRGEGWPGLSGTPELHLPYEEVATLPYGKFLWRVPGCRFCGHLMGANADLTLGDPWKIPYDVGEGMTLIFVRTMQGVELLRRITDVSSWLPIDVGQAKASVDWVAYQRRQAHISVYTGNAHSLARRLRVSLGDAQRSLYERLLLRGKMPRLFLKILNRLPYYG